MLRKHFVALFSILLHSCSDNYDEEKITLTQKLDQELKINEVYAVEIQSSSECKLYKMRGHFISNNGKKENFISTLII